MIDARAVIDPSAEIASDVTVGPFAVIGAGVRLASGCVIDSHVVIKGPTKIGRGTRIFPFAVIGEDPQDRKYAGEDTRLEIGERNVIRESVTISRGTVQGGGRTVMGDDNLIMAYVHIAHDCIVGNRVTMANGASLAGHVEVQDCSTLGGFTLVHQFCRVGAHAFTSMGSVLNRDLPPFCLATGNYARLVGINQEGMRRRGFSEEQISAVRRCFVRILRGFAARDARVRELRNEETSSEVQQILNFIESSERGILRVGRH